MSTYGQTIGFNLGTLYFKEEWKLALIYIMILMWVIGFLFVLIPAKYFHRKYIYFGETLVDTVEENESLSDDKSVISLNSSNRSSISSQRKSTLFISSKSFKKKKSNNYNYKSLLKDLLSLIKNKVYVLYSITK